MFSYGFCRFSAIQPMCQNTPKMLPKPSKLSPRSPTWRYLGPSWSQFALILPLMLAILPVLLAILAPICPTSARKMLEKCHVGANIAKKVLQPPLQAPQNTKKPMFSFCFCRFSAIQPMCQNAPNMLPKPRRLSPRSLTWRYLGRSLLPTRLQLRPSCAHLRANLRRNSLKITRRTPKGAPRSPRNIPGQAFGVTSPLQAPQNTTKMVSFIQFL